MTKRDNNLMGESPNKSLFQQLQELLLKEEREYALNLRRRLDSLEIDQQTSYSIQTDEFENYKKESAEITAQLRALIKKVKEQGENSLATLKQDTKQDISSLQSKTEHELSEIKAETKQEIYSLKEETEQNVSALQAKTEQELSGLKVETKQEIVSLKEETEQNVSSLQAKTEQELSGLKAETKQEIVSFKEDTNQNISTLKKENENELATLKEETKKDFAVLKEDSEKLDSNISEFKNDYNSFHKHITGFESGVEDFKKDVNEFKEEVHEFKEEINHFKVGIEDPNQFKNKVQPVVEEKIGYIKRNFNDVFGEEIKHSIKIQMTDSREDFIEALYPLIGKLVKSYVKNEFEKLFESINSRLDKTFSYGSFINRIKSYFTGIRYEELAIKNALGLNIEDVYIIHRESGLLIGNYSRNNSADVDMVAGMLAAIKQFAEDAFNTNAGDDLETIEYGNSKIMIQSFYRYYVATVVNGVIDSRFKARLNNHLLSFGEKNLSKPINQIDSDLYDNISKKLKLSFYEFEEVN